MLTNLRYAMSQLEYAKRRQWTGQGCIDELSRAIDAIERCIEAAERPAEDDDDIEAWRRSDFDGSVHVE